MSKVRLVRAVSRTVGGGTPERDNPEFWNGGIPWASVKDFRDGSYKLTTTKEEISEKGLKLSASHLIPAGTPIVCTRMAVGRIARADRDVAINQDLRALYVNDHFEASYLILAVDSIRPQIENLAVGSTVKGINIAHLLDFEIFGPPKPEQSKIAEILSTVDQAIEQTEALIAKHQRIKTGLVQDFLAHGVDERGALRSEQTHKFKDSPLGRIPEEWSVGTLLDATARNRQAILTGPFGADLGDGDFIEEGVPVLRIGNVQRGRLDLSDLLFVSPEKAAELNRYVIKTGDLLFARQGATTGRNALASESANGCLINYHIIRVALDHDRCAPQFIEAMFDSELVKRQIDREKGRGTREGINTAQLKALQLKLPPVTEQRMIASLLQVLEKNDAETRQLKTKLLRQRAALMQDLLTGRKLVTALLESKPTCEKVYAGQ